MDTSGVGRCECGRVGASVGWGRHKHGELDVSTGGEMWGQEGGDLDVSSRCGCRCEPRRVDESVGPAGEVDRLLGLLYAHGQFFSFSFLIALTLVV